MAAGNIFFNQELAPPAPMMVDGRLERYFASSTHGFARFQHTGSALSGVPDVGLLVAGIGMAPATFVMPEGALAAAGYGAVGAVPVEITVARQPRSSGTNREAVPPFKGAWTTEEDEILKEMVRRYGDRRWATIAENLPGRVGKQCRERWTNHLRPDLKKDVWSEMDDRALIEAHKTYGNRWSLIARCLPGRSENAVKNHWNATKRSLKSKRRFKKKKSEQAPPGQFSLLEEYIRSKAPATEPTATPSVSAPPYSFGYGGPAAGKNAVEQLAASSPPGTGMYRLTPANAARSHHPGMMNLNMPTLPDLNAYGETQERCYPSCFAPNNLHYGLHVTGPELPQIINADQDLQVAYTNLNLFPFDENPTSNVEFECQSSNRAYVGGYYSEAGQSSAGGSGDPDDIDVVQMASREFLTPSEDEVTLDLTRFK